MKNKRLLSLDAFRGFTIAAMILVNFPGSWSYVYPPLLHAEWNGITLTDFIFPFFLFIVGVSISLAYTKQLSKGTAYKKLYTKIISRTIKLLLIGIALNFIQHFDLQEIRYTGVLQRIAIVFLVTSLLFIHTNWKTQLSIATILLVGYWLAMSLIPTPGYERAMLEPGINLAAWIDRQILPGKMWMDSWDPEGLFSTLPAIATALMGVLSGQLILSDMPDERKLNWIFSLGLVSAIIGYIWNIAFPFNKNLWTSSFVLFTGGIAMLVLAASIFRVDLLNNTKLAKPGIIFGSNAIAIYVLADLLYFVFYNMPFGAYSLSGHFMQLAEAINFSPEFFSMMYALIYVLILFIPALILYRHKIFFKV